MQSSNNAEFRINWLQAYLAIGSGGSIETTVEDVGLGLGGGTGGEGSSIELLQWTGEEEATGSAACRLGNDTPSPKLKNNYQSNVELIGRNKS